MALPAVRLLNVNPFARNSRQRDILSLRIQRSQKQRPQVLVTVRCA